MPQHRIITVALDYIQTRFDWVSKVADEPTITLPLCSRSMFTALSPSIVDSLFLTVDRIKFFCDFCPTYEYVTALRFRRFDRRRSFQRFDVTLSREVFVELSKPLRFLKTVRFHVSKDLLIAPEIGDELVKRLFLAPGLLQSSCYRTYTVEVEKLFPKGIVLREDHLQLLRALLFHHKEDVREHAACCIRHILNDSDIALDHRVLRRFQAAVMTYSPPLSSTEAAAARQEDATATQPRDDCILKHLFGLLDRPCRNESAWISYIHCARMLYFRNTDIDFDTHVKPYIPTLRYLLTAVSDRLREEIASLFADLLEDRDETWLVKFLESGIFEMMVDMLRETTAQELDRSDENTKTTGTDDDNNNNAEARTPPPLPSYFYPVIRVFGRFSVPSHEMSLKVIQYNFFELIKPRLVVSDKRNTPPLRMQLCWACSNFVSSIKLEFLDAGLLPLILDNAFDVENHTVQKEACFCLANFVRFDPDQDPLRHRCFEAVFSVADRFVQAMKLFFMTNSTVTFLDAAESGSENNAFSAVLPHCWVGDDYQCGRWCLDAIQSCLHTELCMCQVFCQKILVILHQARKKKLQRDHGSSGPAASSLRLCFDEIPDLVSYVSNVEAAAKIFPSLHKEEFDQDNNNDSGSDNEKLSAAMNCETSLQALSDILELELKMKATKNRNKVKTVRNEVKKIQDFFKSVTNRLRTIDETSDDDDDDDQKTNAADFLSFEEPGLSIEEKDLIIGCYVSTMLDKKTRQTPSPKDDDNNNNQETQLDDDIVGYYLTDDDDVPGLKTWPVLIPDQDSVTIINRNENENEDEGEEKDDDAQQECTDSKQRAKINSYKITRPEPKFFRAMRRAKIDVSKVEQLEKVVRRAGTSASETLKMSVSFFDHNIYAGKFLDV